ncbi:MAG: TonB-dependent receptor [Oceanicaulis sp.]|uniref:TonB-dependent receptor family protein n=1 Tax=Glycocaulis sp. TaxID=1969725 RepID=UPI0025C6D69A|nr:TonB-dependent receptor [Glycocaulis sp.]MCC5982475.1 TonB-dependent receptor [Oceanicaulis sp.]MCH8521177.1 TonB-dependent receptor [Glycocaulis sp.]
MKTELMACAAGTALLAMLATPAFAETLDIEASDTTDRVVVTGYRLNAPAEEAAAEIARQAGNIALVDAESFSTRYAIGFADTLAFTAGVVAQPKFGEDSRLSVRGSGLANNMHLRGVELLFNGVPINNADGFGDYQEIDPLFVSHMAVNRGANGFRTGSTMLGGSIEIIGISAASLDSGSALRAEGGSFGTSRLHGRTSGVQGSLDYAFAGTWQRQDGFRPNANQSNGRLYADLGWRWNDSVETRFGVLRSDINQEMPGSLTLAQLRADPRQPDPAAIAGQYARDMNAWRGWTVSHFDTGLGRFSVGGSATTRTLWHPVPVIVDQDMEDYRLFARWSHEAELAGLPVEFTLGGDLRRGETDARVFLNNGGQAGFQIGDSVQTATGANAFLDVRLGVTERFDLLAGLVNNSTRREVDNRLAPAAGGDVSFSSLTGRIGALYRFDDALTGFANISQIVEPPTFSDLTQGGVGGFTPIRAMEGTSYEIGLRGAYERVRFEAALYRIHLDNEFTAFTVVPGIPAAIFNADDTVRNGFELGAEALLHDGTSGAWRTRLAYTYGDFRFDGDAVYGDNRLPGLGRQRLVAELRYAIGAFEIAPSLTWQSGDGFTDYMNTEKLPGHTLVGLSARYEVNERIGLYLEGRNLTDRAYVSAVSTVANAATAAPARFTPGETRALYAGITLAFGGGQ